jgi:hypothetical protein
MRTPLSGIGKRWIADLKNGETTNSSAELIITMKRTDNTEQSGHVHRLTEHEIKSCITEGIQEFSSFVSTLHKRFSSQLPHDVVDNIPRGLVRFEAVSKHAVRVALVAAIGEYLSWDETEVANLSADILEDSNFHDLAQCIRNRIENHGDA